MTTHDLAQHIRDRAQNALETGGTWPEPDRLASLVEALQDIASLCSTTHAEHCHDYQMLVGDYVITRWCTTCGVTDKVERYNLSGCSFVWTRIYESS